MLDGAMKNISVDEHILRSIQEDITSEDITTQAIMREGQRGEVQLICKQTGTIAGLMIFKRVFQLLGEVEMITTCKDGETVQAGDWIATLKGDIRVLLTGERTALNYLQRMSGIATLTAEMVKELEGTSTQLLDTRKTTPGMRLFEKYAVKVGGGTNHRFNLTDGILIKDNHIGAAGSIAAAVERCRAYAPFVRKIEVEVENLKMVEEALQAQADIIMLDNMNTEMMKKAVEMINGRTKTECSGNVNKTRLRELATIGVDYISCGALTHSAPILDFSLKNLCYL